MGRPDYPAYNSVTPSWADISFKLSSTGIALFEMRDIAAIDLDPTVELGEQRGTGGRLMARTAGQSKYAGRIAFYLTGYQKALRSLKAVAPLKAGQRQVGLVHFNIQVAHTPVGDTEIYQRVGRGCRLIGAPKKSKEGTDAEQVECALSVAQIVDIIDGEEVILV